MSPLDINNAPVIFYVCEDANFFIVILNKGKGWCLLGLVVCTHLSTFLRRTHVHTPAFLFDLHIQYSMPGCKASLADITTANIIVSQIKRYCNCKYDYTTLRWNQIDFGRLTFKRFGSRFMLILCLSKKLKVKPPPPHPTSNPPGSDAHVSFIA